jgi:hypothetical protein
MADPTLAEFLQGRQQSPSATLDASMGSAFMPRGYFNRRLDIRPGSREDDFWSPAFGAAMPQSPEEWRHHSLPDAAERARAREAAWGMLPPVQAYRGGQNIARGVAERDPWAGAWGAAQIGGAASPLAALRPGVRSPAPQGPWTPGYMDRWLAGRYQPEVRPRLHPAAAGGRPDQWQLRDTLFEMRQGNLPQSPREAWKWGKPVLPVAGGAAAGGGLGAYGVDTLWHGRDWNDPTVLYRALISPFSPPDAEPPSWWPRRAQGAPEIEQAGRDPYYGGAARDAKGRGADR